MSLGRWINEGMAGAPSDLTELTFDALLQSIFASAKPMKVLW